jgi:hypothetical protein
MPIGLPHADHAANIEQVRWVCSPGDVAGGALTTIERTASTLLPAFVITIGATVAGDVGKI